MAAKKVLSIDDILAANDKRTATVDCPEWGGQVEITSLSRKQAVDVLNDSKDEDGIVDLETLQINLVVAGLGLTKDRVGQLSEKHLDPITRISERVAEISGMMNGSAARFQDGS